MAALLHTGSCGYGIQRSQYRTCIVARQISFSVIVILPLGILRICTLKKTCYITLVYLYFIYTNLLLTCHFLSPFNRCFIAHVCFMLFEKPYGLVPLIVQIIIYIPFPALCILVSLIVIILYLYSLVHISHCLFQRGSLIISSQFLIRVAYRTILNS